MTPEGMLPKQAALLESEKCKGVCESDLTLPTPACLAGEWRAVPPALVDAGKAVQQVHAGHPHMREPDGSIVNTVQADLYAFQKQLPASDKDIEQNTTREAEFVYCASCSVKTRLEIGSRFNRVLEMKRTMCSLMWLSWKHVSLTRRRQHHQRHVAGETMLHILITLSYIYTPLKC